MIRYDVEYENADGDVVTETLYFNLNKHEIQTLLAKYPGGPSAELERIQGISDPEQAKNAYYDFMNGFISDAFGLRREDGKGLRKDAQIKADFQISPAYDALLDLMEDPVDLAKLIVGIMPKSVQDNPAAAEQFNEFVKTMEASKLPPPPPVL